MAGEVGPNTGVKAPTVRTPARLCAGSDTFFKYSCMRSPMGPPRSSYRRSSKYACDPCCACVIDPPACTAATPVAAIEDARNSRRFILIHSTTEDGGAMAPACASPVVRPEEQGKQHEDASGERGRNQPDW